MTSTLMFSLAFVGYVIALFFAIFQLINQKERYTRAAFWTFFIGFVLHTLAIFVRWAEGGEVEVAALEAAEKRTLVGVEWLGVWLSHPPWSNLYESLVSFGWGVSGVSLVAVRRFKIPLLGLFAVALSLLVLGAASLLINQDITPLIPALQSKWIHLHVTMATICYPAFGLAAMLGLFYLMKDGVKTETFGLVLALISALTVFAVGRSDLFNGVYSAGLLGTGMGGKSALLSYAAVDAQGNSLANGTALGLPFPWVGPLLTLSLFFLWHGAMLYIVALFINRRHLLNGGRILSLLGYGFLAAALVAMIATTLFGESLPLSEATLKGLVAQRHLGADGHSLVANSQLFARGPYSFSVAANPFEFMLLIMALLNGLLFLGIAHKRQWLTRQLPEAARLDDLAYKTILFAFPFLTLLILTGAIWAYYAWGRYWGWDPKETWSLVTWIVYSIYLHVRLTHGLEGRWPAVIAVVGFGVVIFTYLGVNILLSGLHAYGGG